MEAQDMVEAAHGISWDKPTYWKNLKQVHDEEDFILREKFTTEAESIRAQLSKLNQEKENLELRLRQVKEGYGKTQRQLDDLVSRHHDQERDLQIQRQDQTDRVNSYLKAMEERSSFQGTPDSTQDPGHVVTADRHAPRDAIESKERQVHARNGSRPGAEERPTGAVVVDAEGNLIGPIMQIRPHNQWIEILLDAHVVRSAKIRPGRSFNEADLHKIYEKIDTKYAKWIACMIQATGDIQSKRCISCEKNQGPFDYCIIKAGTEFTKCGNCEWSRQACRGASNNKHSETPPKARSIFPPLGRNGVASDGMATPSTSRPNSRGQAAAGDQEVDDTPEDRVPITRANLALRHDGHVYTQPECMRGVPVERIDENHPYWDATWVPIGPTIEPLLTSWREKHEVALRTNAASRYQVGRQVNRGEAILKFLEEGTFSPYQLIAKKWISPRIISYDTIFRLVDTIDILSGFKTLDVSPLEWIRHRLQELIDRQGEQFNLAKTIHDFYHDKKYVALRIANGKKSIGRPSGMKMTPKEPKDSPTPGTSTPTGAKKRKMPHDDPETILQPLFTGTGGVPSIPSYEPKDEDSTSPRSVKRAKMNVSGGRKSRVDDDLEFEGYTDTDSYSGDKIGSRDWCLAQVKTRLHTTSDGVTQYWHWLDDGLDEQVFEHQVLAERIPASWGMYSLPYDFHLPLKDISEIVYAIDSLRIIIVSKPGAAVSSADKQPRGDVLAEFKRDRTKRRFLVFCRKKGVKLTKNTGDFVEHAWASMMSEVMPSSDEQEDDEV